jgi:hypothetical protein
VDWYAFTLKGVVRDRVVRELVNCWGEEWANWQTIKSGDRWEQMRGPHGSLLEVNWRDAWVHVQIKGKGCRAVGVGKIIDLHDALHVKFGDAYREKRVDVAWDDYEKRCTPGQFREQFWDPEQKTVRPGVRSRVRKALAREDDCIEGGGSYTVGSRASERMLRVYDKAAQSKGEIDAIRFELECKKRAAQLVLWAMAADRTNPAAGAAKALVGFVDFRAGKGGKRPEWWSQIVRDAQKAALASPERLALLDWAVEFCRQISSGYRLLLKLLRGSVADASAILEKANRRDNPRHAAWAEDLKCGKFPLHPLDVRALVLGDREGAVVPSEDPRQLEGGFIRRSVTDHDRSELPH